MFSWFFRRRRKAGFRYHDGVQWRVIDPVLAIIALDRHPDYVCERDGKGIDEGDPDSVLIAAKAVRDVFGIKPLEEGGLSIDEQLQILYRFYIYLDLQKKSIRRSPTPPSPTGSTSPDSSETIPKPSQGSGSTSTEPSCDTPTEPDTPSTPSSRSAWQAIVTAKTGSSRDRQTPKGENTSTTSTT